MSKPFVRPPIDLEVETKDTKKSNNNVQGEKVVKGQSLLAPR